MYIGKSDKSGKRNFYVIMALMTEFENIVDKYITDNLKDILPDGELVSFLCNGSKRIRSKLAVLFVYAHGKALSEEIGKVIAACELIHNASLLHDDVIDNAELRRGVTTIGRKFSYDISILSGDYLVSKAIELLLEINNSQISYIFNKCVQNMSFAEIRQYFLRDKKLSVDDYIEICKGKTAGLFAAVLESCCILSDIESSVAERFGNLFGVYYQIKNDMESYSESIDKKNKILTLKNIAGIENTQILLDNYRRELNAILAEIPQNRYSLEIEDIINNL